MLSAKRSSFDAKKAARFDRLMQRYFQTANQNGGRIPLWWLPDGPPHIMHSAMNRKWKGEPVASVRVRAVDWYFDRENRRLVKLKDTIVREINIGRDANRTQPKKPWPVERLHARETNAVRDRGSDMTFNAACEAQDVKTVMLLGDVVFHRGLQQQAFAEGYESLWGKVADLFRGADATWANIEGTLSCCLNANGEQRPDPGRRFDNDVYTSGNKSGLNMHPEIAQALKDIGVDVVQTANNHSLDRGARGAILTLDALDAAGLAHTGTRRSDNEPWYALTNVDGLRIAWLGCSEWSNNKRKSEQHVLLNCVEQREEVLSLLRELSARTDVDALLFFPSGGKEKRLIPDDRLRNLALEAAEIGAAAVIGFHTHHLQTWEKHTTQDGREVPLIWSRGNFVTFERDIEQRTFTLVTLGLALDHNTKKARVVGLAHVPLFLEMSEATEGKAVARRWLVAVDREPGHDAARALAMSRFGRTRLHPPSLPIDVRAHCTAPEPPPWQSGPGELCVEDAECAAPLACHDIAEAVGMCTQRCTSDDACPQANVGIARCVTEPAWGEKVCLRTCVDDLECPLHTACVERDGQRVCSPR